LEGEVDKLRKDKERLQVINHDLQQYAPKTYHPDHLNQTSLDESFLDLKQKNVIEVLDHKTRQLKKKNDMLLSENENLRTELKLLCAADQDLHDDFSNCNFMIYL
jgi:hypothetical protein